MVSNYHFFVAALLNEIMKYEWMDKDMPVNILLFAHSF